MVVTLKTGMLRNRYGSSTTQVSSKIFTSASRAVVSHPTEGDVHLPPLPRKKSQPPGFSSLPQHSWVLHEVVLPWGGRKEVSAGVNSPASLSEREQEQFCQTTEQRIHYSLYGRTHRVAVSDTKHKTWQKTSDFFPHPTSASNTTNTPISRISMTTEPQ